MFFSGKKKIEKISNDIPRERIKNNDEDTKKDRKGKKETSKYSNDRVTSEIDIETSAVKLINLDLNCKVKLIR